MKEENNAVEKVENIANQNSDEKRLEKARKKARKKQARILKKDEKARQILAMRRERSRQLAEKLARKDEIKKRKLEEREKRKNIRLANRQKNRESRKGLGGWITAVVSLSVFTVLLSTALVLNYVMPSSSEMAMDDLYAKSFYDTTARIKNIDTNLSKVILTKDDGAMQKYLVDIAINSELAENDINQLPLQDESKFYTTKLINQIGDYSKYLNNKIIDGEKITTSDREVLLMLYNANVTLKNSLQAMTMNMNDDYSFYSIIDGDENNIVLEQFSKLQNLSVEYPELIYDGPFSDGRDNQEVKGLTGEEINEEQAKSRFVDIFSDYGLEKIQVNCESKGMIPCFNIQAEVKDEVLYAQISKKGGELIMFSYSGSCKEINFTRDEIESKASAFLEQIGLKNMVGVWLNLANNVYTINYAYSQDGIIVYSDLVKVRICAETGMIIGLEATSYYTNHTKRVIPKPTVPATSASSGVYESISIETSRLCIVPVGNSNEKLCYEFSGRNNGTLYFVYIDATTGKQVQMFKVIDTQDGELLI